MDSSFRTSLLTALLALVFGFLGAAAWSYSGLADNRTRAYLLDNPKILEELAIALQDEQARERLAGVGDEVYAAFPGAVIGGLILGVGENVGAGVTSSGYKDLIVFVILILILLFRQRGFISGQNTVEET